MIDFRPIDFGDIEIICAQRKAMFLESGCDPASVSQAEVGFKKWLRRRLSDGAYFGFVVQQESVPIGGIGLMCIDWPPHPLHPASAVRGYILNLFVDKIYRGQRIASRLMNLSEKALSARGAELAILHPTRAAEPLYERLGWTHSGELRKQISSA